MENVLVLARNLFGGPRRAAIGWPGWPDEHHLDDGTLLHVSIDLAGESKFDASLGNGLREQLKVPQGTYSIFKSLLRGMFVTISWVKPGGLGNLHSGS